VADNGARRELEAAAEGPISGQVQHPQPPMLAPSVAALARSTPAAPVGNGSAQQLPDDWLNGKLTPQQERQLSAEQRNLRDQARIERYYPNPLKDLAGPKESASSGRSEFGWR
jgi:hypothetical protein